MAHLEVVLLSRFHRHTPRWSQCGLSLSARASVADGCVFLVRMVQLWVVRCPRVFGVQCQFLFLALGAVVAVVVVSFFKRSKPDVCPFPAERPAILRDVVEDYAPPS